MSSSWDAFFLGGGGKLNRKFGDRKVIVWSRIGNWQTANCAHQIELGVALGSLRILQLVASYESLADFRRCFLSTAPADSNSIHRPGRPRPVHPALQKRPFLHLQCSEGCPGHLHFSPLQGSLCFCGLRFVLFAKRVCQGRKKMTEENGFRFWQITCNTNKGSWEWAICWYSNISGHLLNRNNHEWQSQWDLRLRAEVTQKRHTTWYGNRRKTMGYFWGGGVRVVGPWQTCHLQTTRCRSSAHPNQAGMHRQNTTEMLFFQWFLGNTQQNVFLFYSHACESEQSWTPCRKDTMGLAAISDCILLRKQHKKPRFTSVLQLARDFRRGYPTRLLQSHKLPTLFEASVSWVDYFILCLKIISARRNFGFVLSLATRNTGFSIFATRVGKWVGLTAQSLWRRAMSSTR